VKTPKYCNFLYLNFLRVLLLLICCIGQIKNVTASGSIIVLTSKGMVNAITPTGKIMPNLIKPGTVLAEGFSVKTGLAGESSILFSNGTVASIEPNSQIQISLFTQEPFDSGNLKIEDLKKEPSKSQLTLNLDLGSLVVQTKKLNRGSAFTINSALGTAGIRGTEFQMGISPAGILNLDVSTSVVSFTPQGGAPAVIVTQGNGIDISQSGALMKRAIKASIAKNISTKNKMATIVAGKVALSTVQVATQKAKQLAQGFSNVRSQKSKSSSSENKSNENSEKEDSKLEIIERSTKTPRSVSGSETSKGYFDKIRELLKVQPNSQQSESNSGGSGDDGESNSGGSGDDGQSNSGGPTTNPPTNIPGGVPPTANPTPPAAVDKSLIASISYEFDPNNQSLTLHYLDEIGNPLASEQTPIYKSDYTSLNGLLSHWENNQAKDIDIFGLQVFMKELNLNPSKYDNNLNEPLQRAIQLSRIFLNDLNIQNTLPDANIWNAQKLIGEFANNPYAFEFGQILIRYGAFGESGSTEITNIGNQIIDILGGRNNLSDSNYLNNLTSKLIQPGDNYNGKSLNGDLLGTRTAKLSSSDSELLQVNINNINGAIGSIVKIEPAVGSSKSIIDVSPYLTKASSSTEKKVFAIAAVKDLHIKGDVHFSNSNHSEDHALAIGAADDIHIDQGSMIYNEGSNLGIASYDTLQLIDVDIDTGGNLAVASLDELHIKSTNPNEKSRLSSTFSVGRYSDSDNLYLYADQLVDVDGLRFSGNMREIYMEAITINLKNINFPSNSEVMLRSKDGYPTFGLNNQAIGAVNFIENVKHGSRSIDSMQDFNSNSSGYDSKATSGNSSAIKIRKFPN
jgi:hypothetical protein